MLTTKLGSTAKKLQHILRNNELHWIGNGFPVRSLFSYPQLGVTISPFLLFDYAGPLEFPPTTKRLGVGEHSRRGRYIGAPEHDGY